MSNRVIAWCAGALTLVAAGIAWPLLTVYGLGLEAVRTVGTIVLGAGGAIGLLLAARRQQTAERDLVEKRRDLAHKERVQQHTEAVAADTLEQQRRLADVSESDAVERRITELYAKAVEQLGSDKAPVRLGGLYALEGLAQNTLSQRLTIVYVLCAYLRMPYDPARSLDGDESEAPPVHAQETHVRIAAQRILALHLRPGPGDTAADTFWPDVDLDLAGATLGGRWQSLTLANTEIAIRLGRCVVGARSGRESRPSSASDFCTSHVVLYWESWLTSTSRRPPRGPVNGGVTGEAGFLRPSITWGSSAPLSSERTTCHPSWRRPAMAA